MVIAPLPMTYIKSDATTASKIVQVARSVDGKNISHFPSYFVNRAWCANFVWWAADKSGMTNDTIFPSSQIAAVSSFANWFTVKGKHTSVVPNKSGEQGFVTTTSGGKTYTSKYDANYKPKAGDIAFFRNSSKKFHHIAIVHTYDASTDKVTVVHGNWYASTSNPRVTDDTVLKARGYDSSNKTEICGYARPAYQGTAESTPAAKTYKLTFNANGGKVGTKSKNVSSDSTYGKLPKPTKSNKYFRGWYTKKTGGSRVKSSYKVTISKNTTVYARWVTQGTVKVKSGSLNVRTGAGTKYKVKNSLKKNSKFGILNTTGDWYKIYYNGKAGYILKKYAKISGTSNSTPKTKTGTVNIKSGTLNVRSGAGTSYSVIGSLKKNVKVTITKTSGSWYKIKYSNLNGYVLKSYINVQ